jgi:capsid portal protein
VYKEFKHFEFPSNKHARIWRYLDFTKFVSMLETKSLWFTQLAKMEDTFEGSYSLHQFKEMQENAEMISK